MARINLSLQLGPMVRIDIEGENCSEITEALRGFEHLNQSVDAMFSDLAKRVFPEGEPSRSGEEKRS